MTPALRDRFERLALRLSELDASLADPQVTSDLKRYRAISREQAEKRQAAEQARRQALYARYIEDEVVPYIRHACGDESARIVTTGASFGAFHAANSLFRRPDQFRGVIAMSGFYDLAPSYFKGYSDDLCYFNNPCWYLRDLGGEPLRRLQADCRIVIVSGRGAYEAPAESEKLAAVLRDKAIPHVLDLWGPDVNHDWPWWRRMLPHHLPSFL